jgi:hypothetical protein
VPDKPPVSRRIFKPAPKKSIMASAAPAFPGR